MKKKIFLGLGILFLVMQFFRPAQSNPETTRGQDILSLYPADEDVVSVLKSACYDCHSHETTWPWYSQINPVGWVVSNHVMEGRDELNFSDFAGYSAKKADHKLEESMEYIKKGEMPLKGYVFLHPEARLSEEQKNVLLAWLDGARQQVSATLKE